MLKADGEDYIFTYGHYKGRLLSTIVENDPDYLWWLYWHADLRADEEKVWDILTQVIIDNLPKFLNR